MIWSIGLYIHSSWLIWVNSCLNLERVCSWISETKQEEYNLIGLDTLRQNGIKLKWTKQTDIWAWCWVMFPKNLLENFQVHYENGHNLSKFNFCWKMLLLWGNLTENNNLLIYSKIREITHFMCQVNGLPTKLSNWNIKYWRKNPQRGNKGKQQTVCSKCQVQDLTLPQTGGKWACTPLDHSCSKKVLLKQCSQLKYNPLELIWQSRLPFWRLFKFESTSISTWILLSKASKASAKKKKFTIIIKMCLRCTYVFYSVTVQIRLMLWWKGNINIPLPSVYLRHLTGRYNPRGGNLTLVVDIDAMRGRGFWKSFPLIMVKHCRRHLETTLFSELNHFYCLIISLD